LEVVETRKVKK
jgi:hypothetical protein